MKVLLAGIVARHPFGGVAWCSLMYLLGLRALGHDVFYVEDTGECVYDLDRNTISTDPAYGLRHIQGALAPYGLGERWSFVNYDGTWHGAPRERVRAFCADADLFLNLSGGSWFWRDEYAAIPRKAFIDSDPAFTQLALAGEVPWYRAFFERFDSLFTFGANVGTPRSALPTSGFTWHHTWQPVVLAEWDTTAPPRDNRFTTVMTWQMQSFADVGGNKDQQFLRVLDLPRRAGDRFHLAVNGPHELLQAHGWRTVPAMEVSRGLLDYRRFIQQSYAEISVAKHTYVQSRSGWFSDRTECYLAAGRPAVVQDTGWTAHLPDGQGLLSFNSIEEAEDAMHRVDADYDGHCRAAREVAREHFDAARVLPRLLERACG
jgi:hypothetical protein